MRCYIIGCDEDAAYIVVLDAARSWCPEASDTWGEGACPGHGFCADHTARNRAARSDLVVSVQSLPRQATA